MTGTAVYLLRNGRTPADVEHHSWPLEPGALYKELEVFVKYLGGGEAPKCTAETGAAVVETVVKLRIMAGMEQP